MRFMSRNEDIDYFVLKQFKKSGVIKNTKITLFLNRKHFVGYFNFARGIEIRIVRNREILLRNIN